MVGTTNEAVRIAWIAKTLSMIPPGSRILDAGAGECWFKKFCGHLNYVSQDFGRYDGIGNNSGLQMGAWDQSSLDIVSDIVSIPQPDNSFDVIMCIEVFEHIPDPPAALREFSRLTKPGGYLILTAPFASLTHFAPFHFCSGFNRYFYERFLPLNGFRILELEPNGNYFEYLAQEIRRLPSIAARYASDGIASLAEKTALETALSALARYSSKDRGSAELLCYGYHVFARKEG